MNQTAIPARASFAGPIAPPPNQPTTLGMATELLNQIATLEMHSSNLRQAIFGEGESNPPRSEPTTLQGVLADACQRAALLCGEMATLRQRLGI